MTYKHLIAVLAALPVLAGQAMAGDPAKGEDDFKKCRSCHAIVDDAGEVIVRGGKTGPNLFGVLGRTVGTVEGFRYGASLAAAGEAGITWTEESLAAYITDPQSWLTEALGDPGAKSKMTFKLRKGADDMAAYLATLGT